MRIYREELCFGEEWEVDAIKERCLRRLPVSNMTNAQIMKTLQSFHLFDFLPVP